MGTYDSYGPKKVQLKRGPCCLHQYDIGDEVEVPDGVYIGDSGIVVTKDHKLIEVYEEIKDLHGVPMKCALNGKVNEETTLYTVPAGKKAIVFADPHLGKVVIFETKAE